MRDIRRFNRGEFELSMVPVIVAVDRGRMVCDSILYMCYFIVSEGSFRRHTTVPKMGGTTEGEEDKEDSEATIDEEMRQLPVS
jgi:hypothetical protein